MNMVPAIFHSSPSCGSGNMKCWQENSEDSNNQHDKYERQMKGHDRAKGVRYGISMVSHQYCTIGMPCTVRYHTKPVFPTCCVLQCRTIISYRAVLVLSHRLDTLRTNRTSAILFSASFRCTVKNTIKYVL
jgi:hypothetical protein